MIDRPIPAVIERPVYIIRLRPAPGIDAERALRQALKVLRRPFGLQCLAIREEQAR